MKSPRKLAILTSGGNAPGMNAAIRGAALNKGWEAPFFLKKNDDPDDIKLNLVINGKGTVWIDDLRLITGPLP